MGNLARGSACWHDFDGVRKRICDTEGCGRDDDYQCPNAATMLVVDGEGEALYCCSSPRCLEMLRDFEGSGNLREIIWFGEVANGIKIGKFAEGS